MATARPNPFRDPIPFNRVRLGGRLIKATLIAFNGLKVEDGWKVDKGKTSSGGTAKFTGTKLVGGEKGILLTFKAHNAATYDDARDIYDMLAPVPGQGGGTAATATTGQTKAVGSPVGQSGSVNAGAGGAVSSANTNQGFFESVAQGVKDAQAAFTKAESSFGAGADKKTADPDPGPRPPTLPIEFAPCANVGVFAVARASWEEKYVAADLSWDIEIGLIVDKPTTPAGAGVMAPPKSIVGTGGSANAAGGTATAGGSTNASAQAEAAGT